MQWALNNSDNAEAEVNNANYPQIRMFSAARDHVRIPNKDIYGKWDECSPKVASTFSAVANYFGKKILTELNVPIGLIHVS